MNDTSVNLRQTIETFIQTAQFDALIDTCKTALSDARERGDKSTEILSIIGLAQGHKFIGKFKEARILIDGAIDFVEGSQYDDLHTLALAVSADLYLIGALQPYEAERDLKLALRIATEDADEARLAELLVGLGSVYQRMSEEDRAVRYARKAFDLAKGINHRYFMSASLAVIGVAVRHQQPEKAMQAYEDAMKIAQQDNFRLLELNLTGAIGELLIQQERYIDEGQLMLEKAVALASDFESVPHEFTALHRLGRALERRTSYERAAQTYSIMLERAQEWKIRTYEGIAFFNLGVLAYVRTHYDDAIANLDQALMIARETNNPFQEASIERVLGENYIKLNEFDEALSHYMAARAIYDALDNQAGVATMLRKIVMTYVERLIASVLSFLGLRSDDDTPTDTEE